MRHIEEFELENLLNSTGSFLFRWRCRRHLKVCALCRKRMELLLADNRFIDRVRGALKKFANGQRVKNSQDGGI